MRLPLFAISLNIMECMITWPMEFSMQQFLHADFRKTAGL